MIQNPWEALCVDQIGTFTLKGKDKTEIDFMCLTMIDTATSWLKIVELPVVDRPTIPMGTRGVRASQHIIHHRYHMLINYQQCLVSWRARPGSVGTQIVNR